MVCGVCSVHCKIAFVVVVGFYVSVSVECDVVSGFGVHEYFHCGFGLDVQLEVYVHVCFLFVLFFVGCRVVCVCCLVVCVVVVGVGYEGVVCYCGG